MDIYWLPFIAVVAALITSGLCVLILRWQILDVPGDRSSHMSPVPTLGGLGILVGTTIVLVSGEWFWAMPPILSELYGAIVILSLLVYDEIRPLGRGMKLVIQSGASVLLIYGGVVLDHINVPFIGVLHLFWAGLPVTFVWLVGVQNIYNFMDGLDGLAGVVCCVVSIWVAGVAFSISSSLVFICFGLTGSVLGFLVFNFPPARIFMGDVGSHFLGLVLGVVAILGEREGVPFWFVCFCLGAFLYDGTYTLLRRLFRGENITHAHRFHLYQRLNRLGWTYGSVLKLYGGFTGLLGGAGYLYLFGYHLVAFGCGSGLAVFVLIGTIWLERRWKLKNKKAGI